MNELYPPLNSFETPSPHSEEEEDYGTRTFDFDNEENNDLDIEDYPLFNPVELSDVQKEV